MRNSKCYIPVGAQIKPAASAMETRARRAVKRHGWSLRKSRKRTPTIDDQGKFRTQAHPSLPRILCSDQWRCDQQNAEEEKQAHGANAMHCMIWQASLFAVLAWAKDRRSARTGGGATIPLKVSDAAVINDSEDDQNRTST